MMASTERAWAAMTVALLVPLAGCLGGDDTAGPTGYDGEPPGGNETGNRTGNNTGGNDTGPQDGTTTEDTRTGSVTGPHAFGEGPSAEEVFSASEDTTMVELRLDAEGGELEMVARPPDCEEAACERTAATQNGNATLSIAGPQAGEWTVELRPGEAAGVADVDYTLVIAITTG